MGCNQRPKPLSPLWQLALLCLGCAGPVRRRLGGSGGHRAQLHEAGHTQGLGVVGGLLLGCNRKGRGRD